MRKNYIEMLVKKLGLSPHPEGGFYKQTYKSADIIRVPEDQFPGGERHASTAIYYLLGGDDFSAWHRIKSDEIWHFCSGTSLTINMIDPSGTLTTLKIGDPLIEEDAVYQGCVKKGYWFCAQPNNLDSYTLLTCTVSPGFDFRDFELAEQLSLSEAYPEHASLIAKYCRNTEKSETAELDSDKETTPGMSMTDM